MHMLFSDNSFLPQKNPHFVRIILLHIFISANRIFADHLLPLQNIPRIYSNQVGAH